MESEDRNRRYDEVRRCLTEADRAFALAGAVEDEHERLRLIDEAEKWLLRAERRLARLADRPMAVAHPHILQREDRSFHDARAQRTLVWRRTPKA
jgi:hypothetical protein